MEEVALEYLYKIFDQESDQITIVDEAGDGRHFLVEIISMKFEGKSRIERSRLVYSALDGLIQRGAMHAVRMKLKTPQEANK